MLSFRNEDQRQSLSFQKLQIQILYATFQFKYWKLIPLFKNALRIEETDLQVGCQPAECLFVTSGLD